jgi:hypothetical protein
MNPARWTALIAVAAAALLIVGGCGVGVGIVVTRQTPAPAPVIPMPPPTPTPGPPDHVTKTKRVEVLDDAGTCQLVFTVNKAGCPVAIVLVKGVGVELNLCELAKMARDRR